MEIDTGGSMIVCVCVFVCVCGGGGGALSADNLSLTIDNFSCFIVKKN